MFLLDNVQYCIVYSSLLDIWTLKRVITLFLKRVLPTDQICLHLLCIFLYTQYFCLC